MDPLAAGPFVVVTRTTDRQLWYVERFHRNRADRGVVIAETNERSKAYRFRKFSAALEVQRVNRGLILNALNTLCDVR